MDDIKEVLEGFCPIQLEEMDAVKLMNRTDTKYIFHLSRFKHILESLKDNYKVLEINDTRLCLYETLYYDTEGFDLYLKHHNGRANRHKIRCRKYVESGLYFLEIKHKNNKQRTVKKRIKQEGFSFEFKDKAKNFIKTTSNINPDLLKPKCFVNYTRITLVNKNMEERLTIDLGLRVKTGQKEKAFEEMVIAELKQDKSNNKSAFATLMQNKRISPYSMSKYCFGVVQLFPQVKQNNFKPKLLKINKILYANVNS